MSARPRTRQSGPLAASRCGASPLAQVLAIGMLQRQDTEPVEPAPGTPPRAPIPELRFGPTGTPEGFGVRLMKLKRELREARAYLDALMSAPAVPETTLEAAAQKVSTLQREIDVLTDYAAQGGITPPPYVPERE